MRRHGLARIPFGLRLAAALAISAPLMAACNTGDFGRPRYAWATKPPPIATEDPLPTGSIEAGKMSDHPLTDDERQLRELANNVLAGPDTAEPAGKRFAVYGVGGVDPEQIAPRDNYPARLVNGPFRSSTARYAKLIDDTRSDVVRLDSFFPVARRVADIDHKREKSLAQVSGLTREEAVHARRRMRENMMLIMEVHRVLNERAAMYRFTLERLVVALPSPLAAEAERIRKDFEHRLAAIQVVGQGGVAAGPPGPAVAVSK